MVGFLLWNYPKGKVFFGDAGAYFIGFMYAQLSIQLATRHADVSAWFVITLAAYPIAETLYSIYRRKVLRHAAAMQPDTRHLHSLLYLYFLSAANPPLSKERRLDVAAPLYTGRERRQPQRRANAHVAPRLWLHGAVCLAAAVLFHGNTPVLIGLTLVYGTFYWLSYRDAARLNGENTTARRTIGLMWHMNLLRAVRGKRIEGDDSRLNISASGGSSIASLPRSDPMRCGYPI